MFIEGDYDVYLEVLWVGGSYSLWSYDRESNTLCFRLDFATDDCVFDNLGESPAYSIDMDIS